ncbi:MAG: DUF5104 domain-containing protein [Clostridium sp.]|jgi:hypothetical protein|nr:DUF5104 domain-containing protein [Clostridium sp.]
MKRIKRIIAIVVLISSILLLSSCLEGNKIMRIISFKNDDKIENQVFIQIKDSIKNRDNMALKSQFSARAISRAENLDAQIDIFFDFFEGEIISWKVDGSYVGKSNLIEGKTKEFVSIYIIETDKRKYILKVAHFYINTNEPDLVGINSIQVIYSEDESRMLEKWHDDTFYGIAVGY